MNYIPSRPVCFSLFAAILLGMLLSACAPMSFDYGPQVSTPPTQVAPPAPQPVVVVVPEQKSDTPAFGGVGVIIGLVSGVVLVLSIASFIATIRRDPYITHYPSDPPRVSQPTAYLPPRQEENPTFLDVNQMTRQERAAYWALVSEQAKRKAMEDRNA